MQPELFRIHAELEDRHWWFVGRRRIMQAVVRKLVAPNSGATVVDIGCGTGANIASLAGEYQCVGVDTSPEAIALARQRYPTVKYLLGPAPAVLGDVAGTADVFLSMDVLEHIEDDFRAFAEQLSAAKPGAFFVITVPADAALWSGHDEAFGHYRRYDRKRLALLWSGLPVKEIGISYFGARLYPVVRAVRTVSRLRGAPFGKGGTDLLMPSRAANSMLTQLFAGERTRVLSAMNGRANPYARGSSLLAVVQRREGAVPPRAKPVGIDRAFDGVAPR